MTKKRVNLTLDPEVWEEAVKIAYEKERTNLSAVVQRLLIQFINQEKKES